MNGMLALDDGMYQKFKRLEPHLYAMDLTKPWTLSNDMALPAPVLATINNWLYEGR